MTYTDETWNSRYGAERGLMVTGQEGSKTVFQRPSVVYASQLVMSLDGDAYCVFLGSDLSTCCAVGFGSTPEAACRAFDLNFLGRSYEEHPL